LDEQKHGHGMQYLVWWAQRRPMASWPRSRRLQSVGHLVGSTEIGF
jgi:hypothetical protein